MEFRLIYDGPLKTNAGIRDKHILRKAFHEQLRILWAQPPLIDFIDYLNAPSTNRNESIIIGVDDYRFVPLVCQKLHLICELEITLLRPEPPGAVITQGGDIDNRLKTLFDSLRMPKNINEIPTLPLDEKQTDPIYCLLEDDNLITKVSVTTDRLLRNNAKQNDVVMLIHVVTKAVKTIWGNMGLA